MPMENWRYQDLTARVLDIINIVHRFQAQETIGQGRNNGLFNMEGSGDSGASAESEELWGWDVNTYEPVKLAQHV